MRVLSTVSTAVFGALSITFMSVAPAAADGGVPLPNHDRPAVDTSGFDTTDLDMVDDDALPQTQSLFAYLKGVGRSGHTLFGHQNDATDTIITSSTAARWSGVASDVYNSVGDFPAVHGYSPNQVEQVKDAYRKGAIIAVEHHVANLSNGTGGGYGNVKNPDNPVEQVLPGGPEHDNLKAYLDRVADWASQYVDDDGRLIPVVYRPWHEHNGDWFWWTTSNATEGEFRELFRFTVHYLRDVKGVSNFLYAFSPNGHFENEEEYLYAYPGDEYVDLLGVDVYWDVPQGNPDWLDQLVRDLRIAVTYAERTGKIAALTETGIRWDASNGLKLAGAEYATDWFTTMQTRIMADPVARGIAYVLVWRNGGTNHFWVPFKGHRVHGDHEMLPDFVRYYNRDDVVFAGRVGDYTGLVPGGGATVRDEPVVTIHEPVFKKTVSGATTVRVHAAAGHVTSTDGRTTRKVDASSVTVSLGHRKYAAVREPGTMFWTAVVDTTEVADGRRPVAATAVHQARDGRKVYRHTATDRHDVFVVNRPVAGRTDPLLIDDFESYDDTDDNRTDLERVWWRDGSRMNGLRLRNSDGPEGEWTSRAWHDGMDTGTVLRVKYDAVGNSDSQVTRPLRADWSRATAFSAWVQPDGKGYDLRFRFAVAGGRTFEVSLNAGGSRYGYDPLSVTPQRVTVALGDFKDVGTGLPATTAQLADVTAFSLRFEHQDGTPPMAGLNALEYYLFDDLTVRQPK